MNLVYKQFGRFERSGKPHHTKKKKTPQAQANQVSAGSPVFNEGNLINTHFPFKESSKRQSESDTIKETDDFIEQCIHEYFTWLAQTEVKRAKLALSSIEPFKTTDWSAFEHKEATTNSSTIPHE